MTFTTGNAERDRRIFEALRFCREANKPLNLENVRDALPSDFDLLPGELVQARRALSPKWLEKIEPPHANGAEPPHVDAADAAPRLEITREQSQAAVESAHNRLGEARVLVKVAQQRHADTKATLARAITTWQNESDPLTPAERQQREIRNHIASENARRAARHAPAINRRIGNSTVDRTAAYGRDPSAEGFARSQMQTGYRRGAYPASMRGRRLKVPSEHQ